MLCKSYLPLQRTKIFVGSLGNGARPEELRRLFEGYGVVTECDVVNRCGFVHMETEDQAASAIEGLNNSQFNGQTISVEWGRQKERGGGGGGGGGGFSSRGGYGDRGMGGPMRFGGGGRGGGGMRSGPYDRMSRGGGDYSRGYGDDDRNGGGMMGRGGELGD